MRIRIGAARYVFRPGGIPTLVVGLTLPLLVGLGAWQLERAREKAAIVQMLERRSTAAPASLNMHYGEAQGESLEALQFRQVQVRGALDTSHQFLLDNRIRDGRVGFEVLIPLNITGSEVAIMVNRGWVAQGRTRAELPNVNLALESNKRGSIRVSGVLTLPETGFHLGPALEPDSKRWPRMTQFVDYQAFEQALGYALLPAIIRTAPGTPWALDSRLKPMPFGPERHYGYAFQWFALALALILIYLFVNTRRLREVPGD